MRRILGIVLGAIAATVLIAGMEALATLLYPFPQEIETLDPVALAATMSAMPLPAKLMIALGWTIGAFGGAWLALRVCDWRWAGWIVALLVAAGGIANILALPHPVWMQVAAILAPLLGGWLAQRIHHKPYRGEPLLG
ncbi:hypothetical protein [Sphingomonas sp. Leaf357]|uniref:hypothetical protein n=1 Tax=Sphingomonas sp. Leaf357 TaxID=1736350 RepID=UPI0012E233A1|nr:hypothetical protein [Sphingomonas sp. Leaf357]